MDDEEEIDIINFDDISKISSGQLLSCDYTVHPKWVNENAEGGNFWSDSVPKHDNLENNVEVLHSEEVVIEEPETKPNILDLRWAAEVAVNEDVVFEEDIPAAIEEIVTNAEEYQEEEYSNNNCQISPGSTSKYSDLTQYHWDEPAAFETHPPPKNNQFIGPTNSRSLLKVKIKTHPIVISTNPRSLLKSNHPIIQKPIRKFKQTLTVSSTLFDKCTMPSKKRDKSQFKSKSNELTKKNTIQPKFKQSIKLHQSKFQIDNINRTDTKITQKTINKTMKSIGTTKLSKTQQPIIKKNRLMKKPKKSIIYFGENITINHDVDLEKKLEPLPLIHSTNNLDNNDISDIEIDVEGEETDITLNLTKKNNDHQHTSTTIMNSYENNKESSSSASSHDDDDDDDHDDHDENVTNMRKLKNKVSPIKFIQNNSQEIISKDLLLQLSDMKIPKEELKIDPETITDLEKYIHSEFFEGRIIKTPEQYLRIRNHILTTWYTMKNENYVSKTAVRDGLKHGGDVNCISRIHRLLEQIGAINFGFQGKYFEYVRPLEEYMSMFIQNTRANSNLNHREKLIDLQTNVMTTKRRNRTTKKIFHKNAGRYNDDKTNSNSNSKNGYLDDISKSYTVKLNERIPRHIQTELDLVNCLKYSKDNLAPFKVSITLSTLLCIQFHSLSNVNERMGFIGGHRSKSVGRNKLSLTRYKPCRTSEQSGTMCEMCPVSQVEQSAILKSEGFELLGWFHSHPLFPSNPSRTDVRTQQEMQLQFSLHKDRPFIGLIYSCLNMTFKCMYVMPTDLHSDITEGTCLPYELDVDIIKDCTNFHNDIQDVILGIKNDQDVIDMEDLIKQFKTSSAKILQQFGYNTSTIFNKPFWK